MTSGSTFDNAANLPKSTLRIIRDTYGDTKLARQELYGELLSQLDGAIFAKDDIERNRSSENYSEIFFYRIAIGVDPAVSFGEDSALHGIVAVGLTPTGHCYVLEDASMRGAPKEWAAKINELNRKYSIKGLYPTIVAERNNGGALVETVLKQENRNLIIKTIHASEGKSSRAEPASLAYSKNLIHHLGYFPELEEQMLFWLPGISKYSPDRLDALVYAITELIGNESQSLNYLLAYRNICRRCGFVFEKTLNVCCSCGFVIESAS